MPCDRDLQPVQTFQAFTPDLHVLAAWLMRCGIQSVALEATGIYWLSLYEVLEQHNYFISACPSPRFSVQREGYSEHFGARPMQNAAMRILGGVVAEKMLKDSGRPIQGTVCYDRKTNKCFLK